MFIECIDNGSFKYRWYFQRNRDGIALEGENESRIILTGNRNTHSIIRTPNPLPADLEYFYFEVEIINAGQEGLIGIGLTNTIETKKQDGFFFPKSS